MTTPDVRCKVCDKPYENRAPLLVRGERDGKSGMFPPTPEQANSYWYPTCSHKSPLQAYIVEPEEVSP